MIIVELIGGWKHEVGLADRQSIEQWMAAVKKHGWFTAGAYTIPYHAILRVSKKEQ